MTLYCKKCGEKISDDSVFCYKCGTKQFDEEPHEQERHQESSVKPAVESKNQISEDEKDNGCGIIVVFFFAVIFLIALMVGMIMASGKINTSCGPRTATTRDIEVETDLNLSSLGIDVIVMPEEDISDLELKLTYYDNVDRYLKEQTFEFGDVKEGVKVKKTVSIVDFSLSEAMNISKVKITVVGGTVE